MKKILKKILLVIDDRILRIIVKWIYPQYKRPRQGYRLNIDILIKYVFPQKILRINGNIPWPVDFRSKITGWKSIEKGILCDPGDNIGIYISAAGGLKLGNNVNIGQNTTITTTNHDKYDHRKTSTKKIGIVIGDNVWIGANCSIVAGVTIGSNVTIGAGCFIREDIPSNRVVVVNSNSLLSFEKKEYKWDVLQEKLN